MTSIYHRQKSLPLIGLHEVGAEILALFLGGWFTEGGGLVAADAKLTQGRRLKIDPPRRGVLLSGGPHVSGGGSGGDPGLETARQEHSQDRTDARRVTQYGAALSAGRRTAAVHA